MLDISRWGDNKVPESINPVTVGETTPALSPTGILQTEPLGSGAGAGNRLLERIAIESVQLTATDCNRSAPTIISGVPGKGRISRQMADRGRP